MANCEMEQVSEIGMSLAYREKIIGEMHKPYLFFIYLFITNLYTGWPNQNNLQYLHICKNSVLPLGPVKNKK
jgi:hypothetical protein